MSQQTGAYSVALTATTATTGGAVASIANPEGETVLITSAVLYVATGAGSATVDIGVGSGATTSYDTLIDGCSVATAGVFDNITDKGSNGKSRQLWPATSYVTVTGSGTTAGVVGTLYLTYLRI